MIRAMPGDRPMQVTGEQAGQPEQPVIAVIWQWARGRHVVPHAVSPRPRQTRVSLSVALLVVSVIDAGCIEHQYELAADIDYPELDSDSDLPDTPSPTTIE